MRPQPMVAAKTERLLNLVICLLYTRRPLTKAQIRRAVAAYEDTPNDEAFDRMFERDKDELRELGIPLLTQTADPLFDDEPGYRIDAREYALPEIGFAPDELALLGLAGRTWAQASLAGPAADALRKLAAAGIERDDASLIGIEPRVRTTEPAFDGVRRAVVACHPIRFAYRGARDAEGRASTTRRHLRPWGLAAWHGRWYVTGFDVDRQAPRVFRLDRIDGDVTRAGRDGSYDVPADHDPRSVIAGRDADTEPAPALLSVRAGAGHALRRRASAPTLPDPDRPGRDLVRVAAFDLGALADEVASYGGDVVALAPPSLRQDVVARLRGALAAHTSGGTA